MEGKNFYIVRGILIEILPTFADLRDFSSLANYCQRTRKVFTFFVVAVHLRNVKRSRETMEMKSFGGEDLLSKKRRGRCGSGIKESTFQRPLADDK